MLNERQLAILQALIDRLVPPDDFPGGWEAGAGDYLLHQLASDVRDDDRDRTGDRPHVRPSPPRHLSRPPGNVEPEPWYATGDILRGSRRAHPYACCDDLFELRE